MCCIAQENDYDDYVGDDFDDNEGLTMTMRIMMMMLRTRIMMMKT